MPLHESNCPLLCIFYAEFDNVVGPVVRCQSPEGFMNLLIGTDYEQIEEKLKDTFVSANTGDSNNSLQNLNEDPNAKDDPDLQNKNNTNEREKNQSHKIKKTTLEKSGEGFSIFDSVSDFIITGNELADKVICIDTHNLQVLSRPTIISNNLYERNSFLSSVGFVLRKDCNAQPYYPVLTKLSSLLRTMEIETQYLSKLGVKRSNYQNSNVDLSSQRRYQIMNSQPNQQPNQSCLSLNNVLRSILINLNSQNAECNLILDEANALNLKLFKPCKPLVDPVPDYVVPILLRPEWQLHMFDWDLTVNCIVPHIDGLKHTRQLSQSPDVDMDMEMVKACLRVLKHHELIAFVDIFQYSNVYEATPLAISMMSNTNTSSSKYSLLLEAFDFAAKVNKINPLSSNNSASNTNSFSSSQAHASPSNSTFKATSLPNESYIEKVSFNNITSQIKAGSYSSNYGKEKENGAQPDSCSTLNTPSHSTLSNGQQIPRVLPSALSSTSRFNAPSSYPPVIDQHLLKDPNTNAQSQLHSNDSSDIILSSTVTASSKQKELNLMRVALSQLYRSCHRNISFRDILLSKVNSNNNKASLSHKESKDRVKTANAAQKEEGKISNHKMKQVSTPPLSPSYSFQNNTTQYGGANVSSDPIVNIDQELTGEEWNRALKFFDHRRLITFGLIHGWIRRVHCFPLAYDIVIDNHLDEANVQSNNVDAHNVSTHVNDNVHTQTSMKQPQQDQFSVKITNIDPRMADKVATAMDGTKCDDELSCMFSMTLDSLIDLVRSTGTKEVTTIYACCEK